MPERSNAKGGKTLAPSFDDFSTCSVDSILSGPHVAKHHCRRHGGIRLLTHFLIARMQKGGRNRPGAKNNLQMYVPKDLIFPAQPKLLQFLLYYSTAVGDQNLWGTFCITTISVSLPPYNNCLLVKPIPTAPFIVNFRSYPSLAVHFPTVGVKCHLSD